MPGTGSPSSSPNTTSEPLHRVIRVFLSSTFRDFMEERDLLVKQVFPELRRKARARGVEVVEVDLRWGITEEESRQGKVLPICLAEINRCRPYFVGLLGERYGWVPPDDVDNRVVLFDEPWVEEHLGRRSVTELEILHGVLRNPKMAGRAFFYFRDPAWSWKQSEPGFVCDNDEEAEKLADLKQRIRDSGFPVVEKDLPDPETLARRIGEDLRALIEEQFPDIDQPDALEREERKHASYRRARTDLYEDGGTACVKVSQLEQWIAAGEQRILITGESGAGKSALIANWMQRHQQSHPGDVVFAHHLGCSNDANALEPMLARMVQAASKLMAEELLEPIKVPHDYWELVNTVTVTLGKLSDWCMQHERRWIWVLDGLDRLPEDNQQALPWLPLQLFTQLHVVISTLDCPARTILQERQYTTLTIGPLGLEEQKALIQSYMQRYNKTLVPELETKILKHEPARSPLFLRVVLDELRACGRHETLAQQLEGYLEAESVDALYSKALERLELDVGREPVQKVMTTLWASRAGLSETELLAVTKVKPLQWAPIDLGLEGSFGRNGNRLVFDHDYLRRAVKNCYLSTDEDQHEAHSGLADWHKTKGKLDEEFAREHPWQLVQAGRLTELKSHLVQPAYLALLSFYNGELEAADYWRSVEPLIQSDQDDFESNVLEEIRWELERIAARQEEDQGRYSSEDIEKLRWFVDAIAEFMLSAGFHSSLLLDLRKLSVDLTETNESASQDELLDRYHELAGATLLLGMHQEAEEAYLKCLSDRRNILGAQHPKTLATLNNLGRVYNEMGLDEKAESLFEECNKLMLEAGMAAHPNRLTVLDNLSSAFVDTGRFSEAKELLSECVLQNELMVGKEDESTIISKVNLSSVHFRMGDYIKAEELLLWCYEVNRRLRGHCHPITATIQANLAELYKIMGNHDKAESCYADCLEVRDRLLGPGHADTRNSRFFLANLLSDQERYEEAIPLRRQELDLAAKQDGRDAPGTLISIHHLAKDLYCADELQESEQLYREALAGQLKTLGNDDSATVATSSGLGWCLFAQERYEEAIELLRSELAWRRQHHNDTDSGTLESIEALAIALRENGELEEAETLFRELLAARQQVLEPGDFEIGRVLGILAKTLEEAGKLEQAVDYGQQALDHCLTYEGPDAGWTNRERLDLAQVFHKLDRNKEALSLLEELQGSMARLDDPDEDDRKLADDAEELMRFIEQDL
ncbi:tetratricopeptide repeat protein [Cyanobium sp. WKJ7-Wakatipu]|uniref:tetratricopeptide repeat protein n=1 Tax=Cyanobium sp. WKJ7-Wakatipu TaxID=2823726 RepID=UPI0020CE593B|nr:tetratricopeptide repeat protein [Cyanobium sp. WKJ7-Wakatipu]MCP9782127.1 tetratricopeptide repeat protein [Cyanobium sp. WKJ7-Wakatipu]